MRAVIQRVSEARVLVDDVSVGEIGPGLLLLVGVAVGDDTADVNTLVRKVAGLRIFPDDALRMNRSVSDVDGDVLVVSQFTLQGDVHRGRRPSFTNAASPDDALVLIEAICSGLRSEGIAVAEGEFGAHMQVELVNDGPVTIVIDIVDGHAV
ncbi:MAG: D-tyrosyl-tRNA(Tyr) deacylase [Actinobacteria bacterium]|nr:MAG: D-tyrosyl-tRNA(Tyr) deacylase [Actinomycetota bacterium]